MSGHHYYQGIFEPTNPDKYVGTRPIVWRSSWERKVMRYCDETPGVLRWSSESIIVPYISPVDGQPHRYFPDFFLEVKTTTGTRQFLVEVKPKNQTAMPKPRRRTRKYIREVATVAVNHAKWQAAEGYCKERGWSFLVLTEDHLFDKIR